MGTIFRLKDKKITGTYTLKRALATKEGILKYISYRPGAQSIFDEDNEKTNAREKWVVFKSNNHANDPAVQLIVPDNNKLLLDFVTSHPRYKVDYDIYDEDKAAEDRVNNYGDIEKALAFIADGNEDDIKAGALAVFGFEYFNKSTKVCRADLKEAAIKKPKDILRVYEASDFHARYLTSLLYCKGIIRNNNTHTAITWVDTGNTILGIAKGESGIDTLTAFLSVSTPESNTLMQAFQEKAAAFEKKSASNDDKALKAAEAEIERLKAELAQSKKTEDIEVNLTPEQEMEKARADYKELKGEDVPVKFKNNIEWIKDAIAKK